MASNWTRMLATAFIWLMAAYIIGITKNAINGFNLVLLASMVLATVGLSTRWVWAGSAQPVIAQISAEKVKRVHTDRASRLVDSLSDDEPDHLRARLSEQECMVPLEDLLREQH